MANNVANAQREAAKSPELTGTVAAVESWPLTSPEVAIWRMRKAAAQGNPAETEKADMQWRLHGSNQGYHPTAAADSSSASATNAPEPCSS